MKSWQQKNEQQINKKPAALRWLPIGERIMGMSKIKTQEKRKQYACGAMQK